MADAFFRHFPDWRQLLGETKRMEGRHSRGMRESIVNSGGKTMGSRMRGNDG
jgi:hypothetical protein